MNGRMIRWGTLVALTLLGALTFGCNKPADDTASPSPAAGADASTAAPAGAAAGGAAAGGTQALPPDMSKNVNSSNVPQSAKAQMQGYQQPPGNSAGK